MIQNLQLGLNARFQGRKIGIRDKWSFKVYIKANVPQLN